MRILTTEYTDYLINPEEYHLPLMLKKYVFKQFNNVFFTDNQPSSKKTGALLTINLITTTKQSELIISGPEYKQQEHIWTIQFPYQTIHTSTNRNKSYTELFFNGMKTILSHYDIPGLAVEKIKEKALVEISENTIYNLQKEELNNTQYIRERRTEYEKEKKAN